MSFCQKTVNLAAFVSAFALLSSPISALASTPVAQRGMPITFEENQGQVDPSVKFLSRGVSGLLLLSPTEITLRAPGKSAQFKLTLQGSTDATAILGTGEPNGTINYLRGNQPSNWLTNIPSYTQVTYKNIYPQIDLVVYGNNREFESDFVIGHDADPSAISFKIDGKLDVRKDGSLAVQSAGGTFELHRPLVYQLDANGEHTRIECRYMVGRRNQISFALGPYDRSKSLVIDPILSYSTYVGGSKDDAILGITGDLVGNLYVTGSTTSLDFSNSHKLQSSNAGNKDCFVAKFDSTAQHLIYATYLGGANDDVCTGIAVNFSGDTFVAGKTYSTDFPTRNAIQGSFKVEPKNAERTVDGFVSHLDCTGSKLVFSTYLGGGGEFIAGLDLDLLSNVYVAGVTNSQNYPVTPGAFQTACANNCYNNGFLSKITPDGSRLVYSTYLGGSTNYDSINGVAVDLTGSAFVTGEAHSSDFPTTTNAYQKTLNGPSNAFVTKFSPNGSSLVYSTLIGGSSFDGATAIAVDLFGNSYVTGHTNSTNFPVLNAFQSQYKGTGDPNYFILKLNNRGSALNYSTYVGGSKYNYPFSISVDLLGTATVVGETGSPDFPVKSPLQATYGGGALDAAVVNIDTNGKVNFSTYMGGLGDDYGFASYSNLFGCVWIGGQTFGTDFPVTTKAFQSKSAGGGDAFLTRISQ